jgi:hypothetical protein
LPKASRPLTNARYEPAGNCPIFRLQETLPSVRRRPRLARSQTRREHDRGAPSDPSRRANRHRPAETRATDTCTRTTLPARDRSRGPPLHPNSIDRPVKRPRAAASGALCLMLDRGAIRSRHNVFTTGFDPGSWWQPSFSKAALSA